MWIFEQKRNQPSVRFCWGLRLPPCRHRRLSPLCKRHRSLSWRQIWSKLCSVAPPPEKRPFHVFLTEWSNIYILKFKHKSQVHITFYTLYIWTEFKNDGRVVYFLLLTMVYKWPFKSTVERRWDFNLNVYLVYSILFLNLSKESPKYPNFLSFTLICM